MYFFEELSERMTKVFALLSQQGKELTEHLEPFGEPVTLPAGKSMGEIFPDEEALYLIQEGVLAVRVDERILFYFEPGDIVLQLKEKSVDLPDLSGEFAVKLLKIPFAKLEELNAAHFVQLVRFMALREYASDILLIERDGGDIEPEPKFQAFQEGDVLIEQGAEDNDVYTFLEGEAEVFVDGALVGHIGRDELFGVISAFTGEPRSATVRASQAGLMLALPKDEFLDLVRARPSLVCKLVEDMAKTITQLNKRLVQFVGV